MDNHNELVNFHSKSIKNSGAQLICNYKPISKPNPAAKGSLDEWLVERYCLFTITKKGVPLRCNILHRSWLLQDVEVEIHKNTILSALFEKCIITSLVAGEIFNADNIVFL